MKTYVKGIGKKLLEENFEVGSRGNCYITLAVFSVE